MCTHTYAYTCTYKEVHYTAQLNMSHQYDRPSEKQIGNELKRRKESKRQKIRAGQRKRERGRENVIEWKEREGVHLICIHYMLPDNKLQFNPRRGGSHSVVINKWLATCIIYQTAMPSSSSAMEISLFPDLFIHSSLLSIGC